MDFHQLLAKMQQLDQPVGESSVQECGEPMGMTPPMNQPMTPPPTPPSMSVNLNAQGLDNISDILKLIAKVNPDAAPQDAGLPSLSSMPSIAGPGPKIGGLDSGPLKMLPDFDKDNDDMPGGEHDHDEPKTIDIDLGPIGGDDGEEQGPPEEGEDEVPGPGDDDDKDESRGFDPEQPEGGAGGGDIDKDDEQEDEAYANEPDTDVKSVDYMNNKLAGGMNKPKQMVKHSYRQGDNPMAMESTELRSWIKSELATRFQAIKEGKDEGKPGKNFAKIAKKAGEKYGSKEAGERVAGAVRNKLKKAGKL